MAEGKSDVPNMAVEDPGPMAPGRRLGSYEILAAIGAGGMGEVYRARDAALGRDVALKVLPASLASDRDRLSRFEREAFLLASLNNVVSADGKRFLMNTVELDPRANPIRVIVNFKARP